MNQMNEYRVFIDPVRQNEANLFSEYELALVIEQQRDLYKIIVNNQEKIARVSGKMMFQVSTPQGFPSVGDWVMVDQVGDLTIIHHILKRRSIIERKSAGLTSDAQIIATNVDVVFICMSLNENFNLRRLERYLAVCWNSGAIPAIILTKADLSLEIEMLLYQVSQVAIGVDILLTSEYVEPFFTQLDHYLKPGLMYAFIGSSGVGKSTLVNHILNQNIQKTEIIGDHDKGRHTTTSRELYITQSGSMIIDTPGMRELQIDEANFDTSFQDIEKLKFLCKFNDCTHTSEPGCAVKKAIDDGDLSIERLNNYHRLLREYEYQKLKALRKERKLNKK